MKKPLLFLSLIFLSGILFSQQEKYSRVRIFTDGEGLRQLAISGVTIDHGNHRKGVYFESDFSETEIQKIKSSGIKYEIKIDDVSQFYQSQNTKQEKKGQEPKTMADGCGSSSPQVFQVPSNFSLGTMGGYLKYNEFLAHIDSMAAKFPNLITAKQPIDTFHSIQGKDIFWLKISDNPAIDETEPELLYTALHHAREPASLSQLIFYMWYLLENYGTDPEVTYLVDNTEMYFVPMVNPDGYLYNQTTNPNGGGMWRKNRRPHGGNKFGVDLNRNYGLYWGFDDAGSSPDSTSDTYRGKSGFSEPETQAVKYFCENHSFKLVLNYHTYGDLFIYPWSYQENIYTPDSAYFVNYAAEATRDNFFNTGTANQTVGYTANGDSDDWMYGEQGTKNKIFAATPEAGPGDLGFWPTSSKIIGLCQSNMTQNLTTAHFALKYAKVKEVSPAVISSLSGYFPFSIRNFGLDTPSTFTVSITPVGIEFTSIGAGKVFTSLNLLEEKSDSIGYALDSAIQEGTEFQFIISIDNGLYVSSDTVTKIYGQPGVALTDNGNNLSNWTTNSWGTSNLIYHSPDSSITDSPLGNYSDNDATSIELNQPIDLTTAIDAMLTFWGHWEIEPGWDYAQVLASPDNGTTWTPLCGKYTKPGNSNQDEGQPLFDGMQQNWVLEEISLKDFIGTNVKIKFQLISDGFLNYDGFYFDDLKVEIINEAQDPGIDSLIIIPANPNENDTVSVVAFTTFPSAGCERSDMLMLMINDTFKINSIHSLGPLTVICNSTDSTILGKLSPGIYSLIYSITDSATNFNFDDDTIIFTVQPAIGIRSSFDEKNPGFEIFPNPSSGTVFFDYFITECATLMIYNSLGETVLKSTLPSGGQGATSNTSIDISDFPSGIYFYQVLTEKFHSEVKKMIVLK